MGAGSRALLTAALVYAVSGQYPYCGLHDDIPFPSDVQCENYCPESVGGYGSTITANTIDQGKTVSMFYSGGFF